MTKLTSRAKHAWNRFFRGYEFDGYAALAPMYLLRKLAEDPQACAALAIEAEIQTDDNCAADFIADCALRAADAFERKYLMMKLEKVTP